MVQLDLQSCIPEFVTTVTRRLSRLIDLSDPARALRLDNLVTFKSLNSFRETGMDQFQIYGALHLLIYC